LPKVASVIDDEQLCTRNEEAKLGRAAKKSELSGVKAAGTIAMSRAPCKLKSQDIIRVYLPSK
jgi:hypothetical protein